MIDPSISATKQWQRLVAASCGVLPQMDSESLLAFAAGLVCMKSTPPDAWKRAFSAAVER